MGERNSAVGKGPQAGLTIERLPAQDSGHVLGVKSFRFSHHVLYAGLAAKRAANADGHDYVRHCFCTTRPRSSPRRLRGAAK